MSIQPPASPQEVDLGLDIIDQYMLDNPSPTPTPGFDSNRPPDLQLENEVFAIVEDEVKATPFGPDGSERIILNSLSSLQTGGDTAAAKQLRDDFFENRQFLSELRDSVNVLKGARNSKSDQGNVVAQDGGAAATAIRNIEHALTLMEEKLNGFGERLSTVEQKVGVKN